MSIHEVTCPHCGKDLPVEIRYQEHGILRRPVVGIIGDDTYVWEDGVSQSDDGWPVLEPCISLNIPKILEDLEKLQEIDERCDYRKWRQVDNEPGEHVLEDRWNRDMSACVSSEGA